MCPVYWSSTGGIFSLLNGGDERADLAALEETEVFEDNGEERPKTLSNVSEERAGRLRARAAL
jgi:hypothetical protein